jgi:hypothetical protein
MGSDVWDVQGLLRRRSGRSYRSEWRRGDRRPFRPTLRTERNRGRDNGPLQLYAKFELPAVPSEVQVTVSGRLAREGRQGRPDVRQGFQRSSFQTAALEYGNGDNWERIREEVHRYFTGEDLEPYEMVYFKLFESQFDDY